VLASYIGSTSRNPYEFIRGPGQSENF
jgi:hypothetical protein